MYTHNTFLQMGYFNELEYIYYYLSSWVGTNIICDIAIVRLFGFAAIYRDFFGLEVTIFLNFLLNYIFILPLLGQLKLQNTHGKDCCNVNL